MAAYSNVLAFNGATEGLGNPSNVLAFDATAPAGGASGVAAFAAALVVAFSGSGTVINPVASNVLAYNASTLSYSSNVLAFNGAAGGEAVTGTGAWSATLAAPASAGTGGLGEGIENTGSGVNFSTSLAYSFSGDGTSAPAQSVTGGGSHAVALVASYAGDGEAIGPQIVSGSGSQAISLSAASQGLGAIDIALGGTGAQSVTLSVTSDGDGTIVPPTDVTGTGAHSVEITYSYSGRGASAVPFTGGAPILEAPISDAPIVRRARLYAAPTVHDAELFAPQNFPESS